MEIVPLDHVQLMSHTVKTLSECMRYFYDSYIRHTTQGFDSTKILQRATTLTITLPRLVRLALVPQALRRRR